MVLNLPSGAIPYSLLSRTEREFPLARCSPLRHQNGSFARNRRLLA